MAEIPPTWPPAPGPGVRLGTYAGLLSRGIALLTDIVVIAVIVAVSTFVVQSILDAFSWSLAPFSSTGTDGHPVELVASAGLIAFFYYTAGFTLFGRTVGKLLLGVRVVRPDGTNPSVWRSAVRTFGYLISSILFLGFIWAAFDRRHQAWHDKLAGTFVVYAWDARSASSFVPRHGGPLPPADPAASR